MNTMTDRTKHSANNGGKVRVTLSVHGSGLSTASTVRSGVLGRVVN